MVLHYSLRHSQLIHHEVYQMFERVCHSIEKVKEERKETERNGKNETPIVLPFSCPDVEQSYNSEIHPESLLLQ